MGAGLERVKCEKIINLGGKGKGKKEKRKKEGKKMGKKKVKRGDKTKKNEVYLEKLA